MQHEYTLHLQYATSQPLLFSTQMIYAFASVCLSGAWVCCQYRISVQYCINRDFVILQILWKIHFFSCSNSVVGILNQFARRSSWFLRTVIFFYQNSFIQNCILSSRVIFSLLALAWHIDPNLESIATVCSFICLFSLPRTIFQVLLIGERFLRSSFNKLSFWNSINHTKPTHFFLSEFDKYR